MIRKNLAFFAEEALKSLNKYVSLINDNQSETISKLKTAKLVNH